MLILIVAGGAEKTSRRGQLRELFANRAEHFVQKLSSAVRNRPAVCDRTLGEPRYAFRLRDT